MPKEKQIPKTIDKRELNQDCNIHIIKDFDALKIYVFKK